MYVKEFTSDTSQLLIAFLRLLFFTATPLLVFMYPLANESSNAVLAWIVIAASAICLEASVILFFFRITVRITETEVQFLRHGKMYESRGLKYYNFSSSTYTFRYNFIPVLTTRKLRTIAAGGTEQNIYCHCFSKNTFDLFMTSILHMSAKSKGISEESVPVDIDQSLEKHYLFPKNVFISKKMHDALLFDLIMFVVFTGAAIWMFIALNDLPVRFLPFSIIMCAAVAPFIHTIFFRSWLMRHVPASIMCNDNMLHIDDRMYLLSDISGIKATPVNYECRTHTKDRKLTIYEGKKKSEYLLGSVNIGRKPEYIFGEYEDLLHTLKEFQRRSGQDLIFDS